MSEALTLYDYFNLITPVVTAIIIVVSLRATQASILKRLDILEHTIEKAHDRLDQHIVDWHK